MSLTVITFCFMCDFTESTFGHIWFVGIDIYAPQLCLSLYLYACLRVPTVSKFKLYAGSWVKETSSVDSHHQLEKNIYAAF